jgi:hypothetical protein
MCGIVDGRGGAVSSKKGNELECLMKIISVNLLYYNIRDKCYNEK